MKPLIVLMIIDVILGVLKTTFKEKSYMSKNFINGIFKKGGILLLIVASGYFEYYSNIENFETLVIFSMMFYEFTSILENLKCLGVPVNEIPFLNKFTGKDNQNDNNKHDFTANEKE